ncbi:hypothetical protein [Chitinimonas sp.]|uniref:hypothetical protein n=1 Tax=Chitinimonas sp. TaxID=1934313 RepID=UPI002F9494BD
MASRSAPLSCLFAGLLFLLPLFGVAGETTEVRYLLGQSLADRRYEYYWGLLDAALKATSAEQGPYLMTPSGVSMSPARAALEVESGGQINIIVRTTSPALEKQLRPVRIPLDKGLTGYRLFLVRSESQGAFDKVDKLSDLAPFKIGQGKGWVDVQILRESGLQVVEGETYDGLFQMLRAGRFELFSRGVNEISGELASARQQHQALAIERHLLLYYPLPRYFFVSRTPEGERLAARLEAGLLRLMQSGEFDRRYMAYKQQALAGLSLAGRRVLRLPNPTLSPETPLGNTRWWDDLAEELKVRRPGSREQR